MKRIQFFPRQARLLSLALLVMQSACANTPAAYSFEQGWRQGRVAAVIDARAAVSPHTDQSCRSGTSGLAGHERYAVVSYSWGGNPNLRSTRLVGITPDTKVSEGDQVRINISRCEALIPG